MFAAIFADSNANDVITAILIIAVGAILRGIWSLQHSVSRLEGLDEMRERQLNRDRGDDPSDPTSNIPPDSEED